MAVKMERDVNTGLINYSLKCTEKLTVNLLSVFVISLFLWKIPVLQIWLGIAGCQDSAFPVAQPTNIVCFYEIIDDCTETHYIRWFFSTSKFRNLVLTFCICFLDLEMFCTQQQ